MVDERWKCLLIKRSTTKLIELVGAKGKRQRTEEEVNAGLRWKQMYEFLWFSQSIDNKDDTDRSNYH